MFECRRASGRSDADVLIDFLRDKEPGTVFPYEDLRAVLSAGCAKPYTARDAQGAVVRAGSKILKVIGRALHNVRMVGYRLAPAGEHNVLALARKDRADVQLGRGVETLRHVRWDELSNEARTAHEGTLLIMSSLYERQRAMESRQAKIEAVVNKLAERIQ